MDIKYLSSNKGNMIKGVCILKPRIFEDNRGFFYESWNQETFNITVGKEVEFLQDNHSFSNIGVLRGLHYQMEPKLQGKLVRCTSGSVFDVVVDIRKSSPTFGEWASIVLSKANKLMIWIPNGFAHGFLSLEDESEIMYKATNNYSKKHERSIRWNDNYLKIEWPLNKINFLEPVLSEKDSKAPLLKNAYILD